MKKEIVSRLHKNLEDCAHHEGGVEYWLARELQGLLGYAKWENFEQVIAKAKTACVNSGHAAQDHFPDVRKMVEIGPGVRKILTDRGIVPESLPAAEDVKKVERRLKSEQKKLPGKAPALGHNKPKR